MTTHSSLEKQLEEKGWVLHTTVGVSMEPMLHHSRSQVRIDRLTHPPKAGDVVLYRGDVGYVLHRVIKVQGDMCLIRGDNCAYTEHVPVSALLGILTAFSPDGGDMIPVTDSTYQAYVRRLFRLRSLKDGWQFCRRLPGRCIRKMKKILHKGVTPS